MSDKGVPKGVTPAAYGPDEFQQEFFISGETRARLECYVAFLQKWQPKINLIGNTTLPNLWQRHMRDSAQLLEHMPITSGASGPWLDVGSGAGFPGLVLALLQPERSNTQLHLIESDQRKAIFLREVIRATHAPAQVHTVRVENLVPEKMGGKARLITARAFASLHQTLEMAAPMTDSSTVFLLLKGQDVDGELTLAAKYRKMTVSQHPSRTNPAGMVLRITEVARV